MSTESRGLLAAGAKPRLAFVDNIRWTVIAMVVLMHACVTYSGIGSWYYVEGSASGIQALVFMLYQSFAQAFFMGLLFFIAAVFTPGAYDRKGFGRFLLDRLIRLGVPTLIFMLILDPLTSFIRDRGTGAAAPLGGLASRWAAYVTSGAFLGASGPLWFTFALLIFSALYALVRLAADGVRRGHPAARTRPALSGRAVSIGAVCLFVLISLGSFLVRLVQPIGTSVMNMQLPFFTQYIVLFCAGLWAARSGLLTALPTRTGTFWMRLALAVGIPAWFLLGGLGGVMSGNVATLMGGWHWQAAGYAAWEAFFAVSFSIGLLVLYRERANVKTRIAGLLSSTSFGIYVLHAPILLCVTMVMRGLFAWPLAKALLAAAAAWLISLGAAWLVQKTPGLRRLFQ